MLTWIWRDEILLAIISSWLRMVWWVKLMVFFCLWVLGFNLAMADWIKVPSLDCIDSTLWEVDFTAQSCLQFNTNWQFNSDGVLEWMQCGLEMYKWTWKSYYSFVLRHSNLLYFFRFVFTNDLLPPLPFLLLVAMRHATVNRWGTFVRPIHRSYMLCKTSWMCMQLSRCRDRKVLVFPIQKETKNV